jgi:hypothetical protein
MALVSWTNRRKYAMHRDRPTATTATAVAGFVLCSLLVAGCESKKDPPTPVAVSSLPPKSLPPLPAASALVAAPVASAAAAPAALSDYSLEGIGTLPEDCVDPNLVLSAVPKSFYESNTFDWRHVRQVALANPGFHVVPALGATKTEGTIAFTENEHKPTKGIALVAHCATSKTCLRFAAAYHTVVPTATPTPICGANPNVGARVTGGKSVLPTSGNLKDVLPEKTDVQSLCVRLMACKAARDFKLAGDETQACMMKPTKFKTSCGLKKTCEQVLTCSES